MSSSASGAVIVGASGCQSDAGLGEPLLTNGAGGVHEGSPRAAASLAVADVVGKNNANGGRYWVDVDQQLAPDAAAAVEDVESAGDGGRPLLLYRRLKVKSFLLHPYSLT
ncbi:hypothetical protein E2562_000925 [Oryza meyeriana var. granulata]|uniref:Uncharacterized protein n=1 Tax=Oryza meyeriana var. granulata TaxID=110450 RepID=A0A6G1CXD2_9ORYZ|nr:hypothetical protein E2562_000925 [Oryza meyeriana var. granulata]